MWQDLTNNKICNLCKPFDLLILQEDLVFIFVNEVVYKIIWWGFFSDMQMNKSWMTVMTLFSQSASRYFGRIKERNKNNTKIRLGKVAVAS